MFTRAHKERDSWLLFNSWNQRLIMSCHENYSTSTMAIGVMGTRTRDKVSGAKTQLMAHMLAALNQPLYLIDVRRNGVGAQSSWSPREFATVIPDMLAGGSPYAYLHLPCLAPSIALLNQNRQGEIASWQHFRQRYLAELTPESLDVAQAFVEAAVAAGGMAVFLCAEAEQPAYDSLSATEQDAHYCHRFSLAKQVARRLQEAYDAVVVKMVHLDLVDLSEQKKARGQYRPRVTSL
ncbi:MAG: DUF488 family protein [Candidatus Binatia bacterium]